MFEKDGPTVKRPALPIKCWGTTENPEVSAARMNYAVDADNNIWMGLEDSVLVAEVNSYYLDLLFLINVVSWARVCDAIGNDAFLAAVASCEWQKLPELVA
jgi:hypothetical protein